jgi:hypothetical protein
MASVWLSLSFRNQPGVQKLADSNLRHLSATVYLITSSGAISFDLPHYSANDHLVDTSVKRKKFTKAIFFDRRQYNSLFSCFHQNENMALRENSSASHRYLICRAAHCVTSK